MPQHNNIQKGKLGEDIAAYYLTKKGYKIIKRNWYCRHGEIDIVSNFCKQLVFTEVKLVTKATTIFPTDLYNFKKRQHLRRTVGIFLSALRRNYNWRIDLICITLDGKRAWVEHFVNLAL